MPNHVDVHRCERCHGCESTFFHNSGLLQLQGPTHLLYQCLSMADRRSMVVWWCWGGMPISRATSALAVRHIRPPVAGHSRRSKPPTSDTTAGHAAEGKALCQSFCVACATHNCNIQKGKACCSSGGSTWTGPNMPYIRLCALCHNVLATAAALCVESSRPLHTL